MTEQAPVYDKEDQYKRIAAYVIHGETLKAVFDCKGAGTGFVGITDQRLIFFDQGMLIKKKSMVSIPYHQIIGVASADTGNLIFHSTELTVMTAAGRFEFEFRGTEKAHAAYRFIMRQILNLTHPHLPVQPA